VVEAGLNCGQTSSIMSYLILYQFSRDRVEAGDAKDFLSRFGDRSLPIGKNLEARQRRMVKWQSLPP
jgi:hypothetical protein